MSRYLRTGVARRIFVLFFLTAFIPLTALTIIAAVQISSDQQQRELKDLQDAAKFMGSDLSLRLRIASNYLKVIDTADTRTQEKFDFLYHSVLVLEQEELVNQKAFLEQAKSLVPNEVNFLIDAEQGLVYLTRRLQRDQWLLAEVRKSYLFESVNNFGDQVCIYLNLSQRFIHCNYAVPSSWLVYAEQQVQTQRTAAFADSHSKTAYWSLAEHFANSSPGFSTMVTVASFQSLVVKNDLAKIGAQVFTLTFFIALLTSLRVIRGTLHPLKVLTDKTNALSDGQLNARIAIQTGDEFETLGHSFNHMADEIENQLSIQKCLAQLGDQLQKTRDIDSAHELVVNALRQFIQIEPATVFSINPDNNELVERWHERDHTQETIAISDRLRRLLVPELRVLEELDLDAASSESGDTQYLVLPGAIEDQVISLIISKINVDLNRQLENFCHQVGTLHANALFNLYLSRQLHYQANHDYLTDLPNRMNIRHRVDSRFSENPDADMILAIFDIDRFKLINDTLGHAAGDDLLVMIANRLKEVLPESVVASRFAGDEFILLDADYPYPPTRMQMMQRVISPVLKAFDKPFYIANSRLRVKASIGVVSAGPDGKDFTTLLKNADMAMYEAKRTNPGSYCFNSLEIQQAVANRYELEVALATIVSSKQLNVCFQPTYELKTGRIAGSEALIRWIRPGHGEVRPDQFIPIAEETGAIVEIGEWVLQESCKAMQDALDRGFSLQTIAVNISSVQLEEPSFLTSVQRALDDSQLDPKYLELEITESSLLSNVDGMIDKLIKLRQLGVRIAIDDFGTGYSSLQYLKQLPVDKLKIDRAFVKNLPEDKEDHAIVRAVIALANELDLTVLAEGCETEEQANLLRRESVTYAQGWHFGKPLTQSEFIELLETNRPGQIANS